MSRHCCQPVTTSAYQAIAAGANTRRPWRDVIRWIIPTAGLAMIPKCPLCLATYIAVGSGVGISMSTATRLHTLLLLLFMALLAFAAASRARGLMTRHRARHSAVDAAGPCQLRP